MSDDMAVKSFPNIKSLDLLQPGFDIFDEFDLCLNPYNSRNWDNYAVKAEWVEVPDDDDGVPVFDTKNGYYLSLTVENESINDLLQSLLYRSEADYNDIKIHVNNPILTSDKKTGETLVDQANYVVYAGNSRMILIQNMIEAIQDLADERDDFEIDQISFVISKLNHDIDSTINQETLYTEQIRDNTSVALSTVEKGRAIKEYLDMVCENDPNIAKTKLAAKAATQFGVKPTYVYQWKQFFEQFPEWFQMLHTNDGVAVDTLRLIFQAFKAVQKLDSTKTLKEVYEEIKSIAILQNSGNITRGIVETYRENLEPKDQSEVDDTGASPVDTENASEETEDKGSKTFAFDPDTSHDEVLENVATCHTLGAELIGTAYDRIESLDITRYEAKDALKIMKALDRLITVIETTLTAEDREAIKAEKEREKLEKQAAKDAAKLAEQEGEDPNANFEAELESGVTV